MLVKLVGLTAVALIAATQSYGAFGIQAISGFTEASPASGSNLTSGGMEGPSPFLIWEGVATPASALFVDHDGTDGSFNAFGPPVTSATAIPASLSAGVKYGSFLVHFDPLVNSTATASVTFDAFTRIVGVIFDNSNGVKSLNNSDSVFNSVNQYQFNSQAGRGLDFGSAIGDGFVISNGGRTLSFVASGFDLQITGGGVDQLRIVVQAVPELTTLSGWSLLVAIGCVSYRRLRRFGWV